MPPVEGVEEVEGGAEGAVCEEGGPDRGLQPHLVGLCAGVCAPAPVQEVG